MEVESRPLDFLFCSTPSLFKAGTLQRWVAPAYEGDSCALCEWCISMLSTSIIFGSGPTVFHSNQTNTTSNPWVSLTLSVFFPACLPSVAIE